MWVTKKNFSPLALIEVSAQKSWLIDWYSTFLTQFFSRICANTFFHFTALTCKQKLFIIPYSFISAPILVGIGINFVLTGCFIKKLIFFKISIDLRTRKKSFFRKIEITMVIYEQNPNEFNAILFHSKSWWKLNTTNVDFRL